MHERFKKEFKEFGLSLSEVELKIGVKKNYLSQFINGDRPLPAKWEAPIDNFLAGIRQHLKKLEAPPPNPDILRPWIKIIDDYCKGAGITPEDLVDSHKRLKILEKQPKTSVTNLTPIPPKTNYTVNTGSNWLEEQRRKKCGF